jgi:DNA-binding transcriptional ArsR family regulator
MSLLPSDPDPETETEPRVLGVDSDEAGEALSALSSDTTREILGALHEEPDTASGLADRHDLTLQNVQYHLGKLDDADLVDVVDTVYSEKGREMKVYGPADGPLVVFAGGESEAAGLKSALSRLLGAVAALGVMSLLVQAYFRELPMPFSAGSAGEEQSDGAEGYSAEATQTPTPTEDSVGVAMEETATPTPTPDIQTTTEAAAAAESAAGLPPGALFFLGGLVVLLGVAAVWWLRR